MNIETGKAHAANFDGLLGWVCAPTLMEQNQVEQGQITNEICRK